MSCISANNLILLILPLIGHKLIQYYTFTYAILRNSGIWALLALLQLKEIKAS